MKGVNKTTQNGSVLLLVLIFGVIGIIVAAALFFFFMRSSNSNQTKIPHKNSLLAIKSDCEGKAKAIIENNHLSQPKECRIIELATDNAIYFDINYGDYRCSPERLCSYDNIKGLMVNDKILPFDLPEIYTVDQMIKKEIGHTCSYYDDYFLDLIKNGDSYVWKMSFAPHKLCTLEGYLTYDPAKNTSVDPVDLSKLTAKLIEPNCEDTGILEEIVLKDPEIFDSSPLKGQASGDDQKKETCNYVKSLNSPTDCQNPIVTKRLCRVANQGSPADFCDDTKNLESACFMAKASEEKDPLLCRKVTNSGWNQYYCYTGVLNSTKDLDPLCKNTDLTSYEKGICSGSISIFDNQYSNQLQQSPKFTFEDKSIATVETTAIFQKFHPEYNFPFGFFSDDPEELGLISQSKSPITVRVKFTEPQKLKKIKTSLTKCPAKNCYKLSIVGKLPSGEIISFAENSYISGFGQEEFSLDIKSDQQFQEVDFTVENTISTNENPQQYPHWKKIKFEYN